MIIETLLDTDLYKFTMQQLVFHRFPEAEAEYAFLCRQKEVDLSPYAARIQEEVDSLCNLSLSEGEIAFLSKFPFFQNGYLDSLRNFRLNPDHIQIGTEAGFSLKIKGNWFQTILFEVPLLAIINEIYFRDLHTDAPKKNSKGLTRLIKKCRLANESGRRNLQIIEFGTRRRYSREWQEIVVEHLKLRMAANFLGTSNVGLARKFGLNCFGTMAHEYLQSFQSFVGLPDFQKTALETWMLEYRGELGIALSDVISMDAFLKDFDLLLCKAYDGVRHDSGDPIVWGEKLIAHYQSLNIDPTTKTAVFTDGLSVERALELATHFEGRIKTEFGIGTNLTNDFGFPSLNIVIKMAQCNGRPVAKITDAPGKSSSAYPEFMKTLRGTFADSLPPA